MPPTGTSRQTNLSSYFATQPADPAKSRNSTSSGSATAKKLSDRVETDILLAILPEHLENIVSKQKNHEYRKYRLQDGVERLWFYETRGTAQSEGRQAITHIATIPPTVRHTPGSVPEQPFGIGNSDFNAGKKKSKYGYPILHLHELVNPITLDEMRSTWGIGAPMGRSFVKWGMWQDRWGSEDERDDKVKQIF
ncbi:hypothetical protein QQS21_002345 [Conoideocrella luteorostrata]|uniref:PUA-like domain-containing protein n=1 Tax=Conoideocrella luteorostrata TaxID=1105319 RepID=A0AAJ0CYE6_9HYPO|nr:hypothetical protein QQS21_002345 [Conoideocrella luteorostrata]